MPNVPEEGDKISSAAATNQHDHGGGEGGVEEMMARAGGIGPVIRVLQHDRSDSCTASNIETKNNSRIISTASPMMQTPSQYIQEDLSIDSAVPSARAFSGDAYQERASSVMNTSDIDDENPAPQRRYERHISSLTTQNNDNDQQQLAVAAYVEGGPYPPSVSEPSTSVVHGVPMSKRNKWMIAITVLLIMLVGAAIAVAVILTKQNSNNNNNRSSDGSDGTPFPVPPPIGIYNNNTDTPTVPTAPSDNMTASPSNYPTPLSSNPPVPTAPVMPTVVFAYSIQLRDYALTQAGGYNMEVTSNLITTETECLVLCSEYDAVRWISSTSSSDKCVCYSLISDQVSDPCATPWGSQVDTSRYIASGTIYSKQPFASCSTDFCTVLPDEAVCFTANTLDLRVYSLTEAGGYHVAMTSNFITTEAECREFCAEYDAVRWASSTTSSDKCICYSSKAADVARLCVTPWGSQVDTYRYISSGTVYSKRPFATCSVDYCTVQPNEAVCFTANTLSLRDYTLTKAGGYAVNRTGDLVTSESGCREFCAKYDAARWASSASSNKCVCYSLMADVSSACATPWGTQVDASRYVSSGTIFSKRPFATCSIGFCTELPNDPLCFTANTLSLRDYTLTEAGGFTVARTGDLVTTEAGCREFCAIYDAMRWASSTSSDKCVCYSLLTNVSDSCGTPWGNQVDTSRYIASGTIFSKQPFATCSVDYCTAQPDDALCFTANTLSLRDYTLTETGGYAVNTTGDLVTSEAECREFCAEYDAVRWASSASSDKCVCFSLRAEIEEQCVTPWGNQVDVSRYISSGTIFFKRSFATCSVDFCTVQPNDALCFTANTLSLREHTLTEAGGYAVNKTGDLVTSEAGCREFCADYDAVRWASYTTDDKCVCYSLTADVPKSCTTLWGNQVDTSRYIASGTIFSKQPFATCSADFCTVQPNEALCFTANTLSLRDNALTEAGGYEIATRSDLITTEAGCREFCAEYDAVKWASYASSDKCVCYSLISDVTTPCATPWGSQVSTSYVESGSIFSKQPFNTCSVDFCETDDNNYLCFTATQASSSAFVVAAAAEQVTASSLTECFQACQSFGVAEYNSYTDVCQCFDTPDCLAVAADGQSISFRSIYTKEAIVDCSESLCDLVPENELCSTST